MDIPFSVTGRFSPQLVEICSVELEDVSELQVMSAAEDQVSHTGTRGVVTDF